MPKVLHFYKTYYPQTLGGIEQVIFQLAEGSIAHGYESEVLYLSKNGSARAEPLANHLTHRSRLDLELASTGFSLSAFRDFTDLAHGADLIHYHFPWPFMDVVHFATKARKPAVVSYHSDIVKQQFLLQLYKPLMYRFLSSMGRIVTSSPNYAQSSEVLQDFSSKVDIIPYGLDRGTYPSPTLEKLQEWKSRLGEKFYLFIGALRYYKGIHVLLDAAQATNLPVVILGGGMQEEEHKAKACTANLSNVHFVGKLPDEDKVALLTLCYGLVFPSHLRSEAFGISLLEGAMYGKPLISCEIGTGTTFINIAGETGLVVPPADPAALAHAMRSLWEQPAMAAEMGRRALARFEAQFTAQAMVSAYAEIYREILNKSS